MTVNKLASLNLNHLQVTASSQALDARQVHQLPEVSYAVSEDEDIFEYKSTLKKVQRIAWLVLSIIVFPIGLVRLLGKVCNYIACRNALLTALRKNKGELDAKRAELMSTPLFAERCERIAIKTADDIKLDTIFIKNPSANQKPIQERKYIVFFNGNGGTYENGLIPLLIKLSDATGANVYCGNYRGIGSSEGFPSGLQDLIMDGEAMIQYLLSQGVKQKNILVHGFSLGGGVGAHVVSHHQNQGNEMHFCADRTFSSLVNEVKERTRKNCKLIKKTHPRFAFLKILGEKLFERFILTLIYTVGWNFKSLECYKAINGYKFLTFYRKDRVVHYKTSLYKKFKDSNMTLQERKQKAERRVEKIKSKIEGREYIANRDIQRPYRHRYIRIEIDKETDRLSAHSIPLDQTPQYNDYIQHVVHALS